MSNKLAIKYLIGFLAYICGFVWLSLYDWEIALGIGLIIFGIGQMYGVEKEFSD